MRLSYLRARQALLTTGAWLCRPWSDSAADRPTVLRKILFIRIDRIGDMVLSTPALRAIKHTFPGANLTVLASRANAPLLRHDPHVDRVIVWEQGSKGISPTGFLRQAARLAKTGYDAVIDPMTGHDLRTALLSCLSRAPLRIGYPGYGREVFFNRLCHIDADRHIADLVLETTRNLGAEPLERLPHIRLLPG
jgi:ADP-heptose:LPS heptosyltransferase